MTDHLGRNDDSRSYRYEAVIRLDIAADGLDSAWAFARLVAQQVRGFARTPSGQCSDSSMIAATASLLDLKYRPDLDGSLKVAPGPTVGAEPEHTPRGQSV